MALARKVAHDVGAQGPSDKGKVMGVLVPQLRGKVNGNVVNAVVTDLLESMAG